MRSFSRAFLLCAMLMIHDGPAFADQALDQNALDTLYGRLADDPNKDIKGVVVLRHDKLVSEAYFNGDNADTLHDIRSATKSITSLLVGIAIKRGLIRSEDDSIAKYLPGLPRDGKENIAIHDLLTMRSGLDADDTDSTSPGAEDNLDKSSDWIKTIYQVPMKRRPGEKYVYSSINAFLAGAIVQHAAGERLDIFARRTLFEPMGITRFAWRQIPIGQTAGQGNLQITARDFAKFGILVLHKGEYGGHQIIDPDWIEKSTASRVDIAAVDPYADQYGYMWYSKTQRLGERDIEVHFASGNGGNKIYVVPSLDMVIAITSSAYNQAYGQRRSQDILLALLAAAQP